MKFENINIITFYSHNLLIQEHKSGNCLKCKQCCKGNVNYMCKFCKSNKISIEYHFGAKLGRIYFILMLDILYFAKP